MRLENMIWGQLKLEENQAKCRAPWCFFLLLLLFLNMLMYDLVQSVCKLFFFMKPRCLSSIRKCRKRLIFKKILQIWIWFHKRNFHCCFCWLIVFPDWFILGRFVSADASHCTAGCSWWMLVWLSDGQLSKRSSRGSSSPQDEARFSALWDSGMHFSACDGV